MFFAHKGKGGTCNFYVNHKRSRPAGDTSEALELRGMLGGFASGAANPAHLNFVAGTPALLQRDPLKLWRGLGFLAQRTRSR